ncbi:hypothetical protein [Pannonibacter sp. SL95]|uniref:hypothetical protein n=1 Tax=Pannonibacter sp. SL95 TaxID=2995153 RepID=UPI002275CEDE|nr:hypothetical protein [Pannonibacter sp. SL95]MCY1707317.1 hypothetical protein [Pannonibacter sp. SL95]
MVLDAGDTLRERAAADNCGLGARRVTKPVDGDRIAYAVGYRRCSALREPPQVAARSCGLERLRREHARRRPSLSRSLIRRGFSRQVTETDKDLPEKAVGNLMPDSINKKIRLSGPRDGAS